MQMALFARVTTYPPLGQVTLVPPSRKQVRHSSPEPLDREAPSRGRVGSFSRHAIAN